MAYKVLNRVKMTVASAPGVGAITLGSAVAGFQAFSAAVGSITTGDTVHYVLEDGTNWELGLGTYNTTGPTITRTTIIESNNAGSAINATSSAVVYVTIHASDITAIPVANLTGTLPVASGGTGLTSGTSGGVLYYSAAGTLAASGALTANAIVVGGGAGAAPSATTTGTGVVTALGNAVNATGGVTTVDGTATLTNKTLTNPTVTNYTETAYSIGNSSTAVTISLANGTVQTVTMTGNCTFTMPTAAAGKSFVLIVSSGAGSFTGTFTSVKWPSNTAPTLTTTATRWDILSFFSDGTNWYGSFVQAFQ